MTSASGVRRFKYTPLDASKREIRIIQLHPGQSRDRVSCTTHHIHLNAARNYETISYVWGDAFVRSECLLDDCAVSIPVSTAAALGRARLVSKSRYLWIDALCINQDDPKERDEQVALMREIYSLSSGNLIFLDVDSVHTASSTALFGRLWREAAAFTDGFGKMDLIIGKRAVSRDVLDEADSAAFFAMVFSPWFRRVWVMQEAALAPSNTCYIGSAHIPLLNLLRAFRWREYKYHYSAPADLDSTSVNTALRNILTLWRYVDPSHGPYVKAQGASIADALVFARGLNSSQPRDHVFGLLGLIRYRSLPEAIMERLRPAYSRSVLDVFRDATVAGLMEKEGIPDLIFEEIIHRHDDGVSASPGADCWPSWVPKWSDARDLNIHPGRLNKWYFSASGLKPFDFTEVDDVTVQVRGIIVDEVASVTDVCRVRDWSQAQEPQHLLSWLQEVDSLGHGHPRPAINTVLLAGLNSEGRPATEQDLDAFESFRQALIKHQQHGPGSSCSTRTSEVFERMCNNRRFFRTARQGSIGIGPNVMQTRDKIVVVYGCRAPIVIRPLDEEAYSVVGECYVHGMMNGEVMGGVHSVSGEMIVLR